MRTIIAGSRSMDDYLALSLTLDRYFARIDVVAPSVIISGTARGVDQLGERWANDNQIPVEKYPADWNQYGKRAGYLRNIQMAENADRLIAFWDGVSPGTQHMINIARERNLVVVVFKKPE